MLPLLCGSHKAAWSGRLSEAGRMRYAQHNVIKWIAEKSKSKRPDFKRHYSQALNKTQRPYSPIFSFSPFPLSSTSIFVNISRSHFSLLIYSKEFSNPFFEGSIPCSSSIVRTTRGATSRRTVS
jgi:hypothetical protein